MPIITNENVQIWTLYATVVIAIDVYMLIVLNSMQG